RSKRDWSSDVCSSDLRGGEITVVRTRQGRLQMRRALPGKLTREAEQGFLAALSATCNIALAAAAVGAAEAAFHRRKRKDPAFAQIGRASCRGRGEGRV